MNDEAKRRRRTREEERRKGRIYKGRKEGRMDRQMREEKYEQEDEYLMQAFFFL